MPPDEKGETENNECDSKQAKEGAETPEVVALLAHSMKLLRVLDYFCKNR